MPVIGILDPDATFIFDDFVEGMRDLGYVEGQNISYVRKVAQGKPETIPSLAIELVNLKVDVIITVATQWVRAARHRWWLDCLALLALCRCQSTPLLAVDLSSCINSPSSYRARLRARA
jgi:hypothetical protein